MNDHPYVCPYCGRVIQKECSCPIAVGLRAMAISKKRRSVKSFFIRLWYRWISRGYERKYRPPVQEFHHDMTVPLIQDEKHIVLVSPEMKAKVDEGQEWYDKHFSNHA